jgi:hypothetical protein
MDADPGSHKSIVSMISQETVRTSFGDFSPRSGRHPEASCGNRSAPRPRPQKGENQARVANGAGLCRFQKNCRCDKNGGFRRTATKQARIQRNARSAGSPGAPLCAERQVPPRGHSFSGKRSKWPNTSAPGASPMGYQARCRFPNCRLNSARSHS